MEGRKIYGSGLSFQVTIKLLALFHKTVKFNCRAKNEEKRKKEEEKQKLEDQKVLQRKCAFKPY